MPSLSKQHRFLPKEPISSESVKIQHSRTCLWNDSPENLLQSETIVQPFQGHLAANVSDLGEWVVNEISKDKREGGEAARGPARGGGVGTTTWPSCAELGKWEDFSFSE